MSYNLTVIGESMFGKFLSCAVMANPEGIARYNLERLNLGLTLDGQPLDLHAVFSAFERNITNGNIQQPPPRAGSSAGPPPSRSVLESLRDSLQAAQEECGSVNSTVESYFRSAIEAAQDAAGEYARSAVSDAAWDHSPGDCVSDEVWSAINTAIEEIDAELER
jgi:hypothetical protein